MSVYHLLPPDAPPPRPPRRLLPGVVMILLLVGMVGGSIFWLRGGGYPFGPTPTVTATLAAPRTATPDFRATRFAEDQRTAVAYFAKATLQTPISFGLPVINGPAQNTSTPIADSPLVLPEGIVTATPSGAAPLDPTAMALLTLTPPLINLPIVGNQNSPLATPPPLPTDVPTATLPAVDAPTATPTQPPTPTPTPTAYFVASLRAAVRPSATAVLRQAPILAAAVLDTLAQNTTVTLAGRDETGEWVIDNNNRWLRQAYITISGNSLGTGAPQGANPNDVRWLPTRAWPTNATVTPPPPPTLIPFDDFPSVRYDQANTARLPGAFRNNNMFADVFNGAQAAQGPSAPLIVVGPHVLLATTDGRVYTFDKNSTGNQLRVYTLGPRVKFPPVAQDGIVYLVDEQSRITALNLNTDPPQSVWPAPVSVTSGGVNNAMTGVTIAGNRLYIAAASGAKQVVLQFSRDTGQLLTPRFEADGVNFQPFAVGHQLLYVTGAKLWALDLETLGVVWEREIAGVLPPLYASNGIGALAELYVATANNNARIYGLDANTGGDVRIYDGNNELVRGLALGNPQLYAAGNGFIKAYDRRNNSLLWRQPTYGEVLSGPFATAGLTLLITTSGQVQFFDQNNNGASSNGPTVSAVAGVGGAVAGSFVFIPDAGGRVAKLREQ